MLVLLVAAGVLVLDLASKTWILAVLDPGQSMPLIRGVLYLTLVLNPGGAFGVGASLGPVFIPLSAVALVLFLYLALTWGRGHVGARLALALMSGGVAGNLLDRLRWGHVVDFIDVRVWPVFNVADSALTVGAVLLAVAVWREAAR